MVMSKHGVDLRRLCKNCKKRYGDYGGSRLRDQILCSPCRGLWSRTATKREKQMARAFDLVCTPDRTPAFKGECYRATLKFLVTRLEEKAKKLMEEQETGKAVST